jgi:hypothetical protein
VKSKKAPQPKTKKTTQSKKAKQPAKAKPAIKLKDAAVGSLVEIYLTPESNTDTWYSTVPTNRTTTAAVLAIWKGIVALGWIDDDNPGLAVIPQLPIDADRVSPNIIRRYHSFEVFDSGDIALKSISRGFDPQPT